MFQSKNKNNVYPCKPQFYYIKVGFKGIKIMLTCFHDVFGLFHVYCHGLFALSLGVIGRSCSVIVLGHLYFLVR